MAYNYEYPYTDTTRYNDDWLLNKMKELESRLDGLVEEALAKTKIYVDERLLTYQSQLNELVADFRALEDKVETQLDDFRDTLIWEITRIENIMDSLRADMYDLIIISNNRTDQAIQQNNEYIFKEINDNVLSNITVLNYFTGEKVSVQSMFDYLAMLHVDNAITYTALASREKSVTELIGYHVTYTQLAINGDSIITA